MKTQAKASRDRQMLVVALTEHCFVMQDDTDVERGHFYLRALCLLRFSEFLIRTVRMHTDDSALDQVSCTIRQCDGVIADFEEILAAVPSETGPVYGLAREKGVDMIVCLKPTHIADRELLIDRTINKCLELTKMASLIYRKY